VFLSLELRVSGDCQMLESWFFPPDHAVTTREPVFEGRMRPRPRRGILSALAVYGVTLQLLNRTVLTRSGDKVSNVE
jgi:hypothetical protein